MSNNRHETCPALMSDGRIFTNYLPNRLYNDHIKYSNNIQVNTAYKEFLQQNATNIISEQNKFLEKHAKCNKNVTFNDTPQPNTRDKLLHNTVMPFDPTNDLSTL